MYSQDPFTYSTAQSDPVNILTSLVGGALQDYGDHAEIFGFNLLKFDSMKDKLDELNQSGVFKGFSPRWTLPMKLRNID